MAPKRTEAGGAPAPVPAAPAAVAVSGVSRRFGPLWALRDVALTVAPGSIHALIGENGAGKSTLLSIIAGECRPDAGAVCVHGQRLAAADPRAAQALGVGLVHQHCMLVEPFSVLENLVLGREPLRRGCIDFAKARRELQTLGERFGLPVPPDARVADLPVALRQRVEILKVLWRGARLLLLDEPTAVLTPGEVATLFAMLRALVAADFTVLLTTHKLDEVLAVAEQVTVLRGGERVADVATAATDARSLAHFMVGSALADHALAPGGAAVAAPAMAAAPPAEPVLRVERLCVGPPARPLIADVSFAIAAGSIVGVAAVQGNGQSPLIEALAGLVPVRAGRIVLAGRDVTRASPAARLAAGLAHIPEDRHERGLALDLPVRENLFLGRLKAFRRRFGRLDRTALAAAAVADVAAYDIRPPRPAALARTLSGGNQQKVVVARELGRAPRLLVAGQPTRGVDFAVTAAIHARLVAARAAGLAVLLVSADLAELEALADRIVVLVRGRLVADRPAAAWSRAELGECMLGAAPAGPVAGPSETAPAGGAP